MIRTESEYRRSLARLEQDDTAIAAQKKHLRSLGFSSREAARALEPMLSFREQLREEVEAYENMKRGDLGTLRSLEGVGRWLIGVRIARGWTQKELAQKLGTTAAQVSRDERNDYHGITVERAQRILSALGVQFVAEIKADK